MAKFHIDPCNLEASAGHRRGDMHQQNFPAIPYLLALVITDFHRLIDYDCPAIFIIVYCPLGPPINPALARRAGEYEVATGSRARPLERSRYAARAIDVGAVPTDVR